MERTPSKMQPSRGLCLLLLTWALAATLRCALPRPCPACPPPCVPCANGGTSSSPSVSVSTRPPTTAVTSLETSVGPVLSSLAPFPVSRGAAAWVPDCHLAPRFRHHAPPSKEVGRSIAQRTATMYKETVALDGRAQCDPAKDDLLERAALTAFFHSTSSDSSWRNKYDFLSASLSICCWLPAWDGPNTLVGIRCDAQSGRVTALNIYGNGLSGTADVSAFKELKHLDFSTNDLTAVVGLQVLTQLTWLNLFTNLLTAVPGLHTLTQLTNLYISNNQLTAVAGLQMLTQLNSLDISSNQLMEVPGLQALTRLTKLSLAYNQLTMLSGLQALTQLNTLYLFNNQLTAVPGLEALTKLSTLSLNDNNIQELPSNMSWSKLKSLTLNNNKLTALPPTMLSVPMSLHHLPIFQNQLTSVPSWVAAISSLRILDVSHNRLTSIPDFGASNITSLLLVNNQLSLSAMAGRVQSIPLLDVSGNPLKAALDHVLGNLTSHATLSSFTAASCSLCKTSVDASSDPFSHLVVLDVHDNPMFDIVVSEVGWDLTALFPVFTSLDISHTAWSQDLNYPQLRTLRAAGLPKNPYHPNFWPAVVATSSSLQLFDGTDTTWVPYTSSPIEDVEISGDQLVRFPSYKALTCPSWRFKISHAQFIIEASFGDFRGCYCPEGHFFQRLVPWGCETCPAHLSCDTSSSPDAQHTITGNMYPIVDVPGNYSGASLVQAAGFIRCHFPVCNVNRTEHGIFACTEGHDSNSLLCSKCESGYFAGRGTCSRCHNMYVVLVPVAVLVASVAFVWYVATRDPHKRGHLVSIVSFWLQLMMLLQDSTQGNGANNFHSVDPQSVLQQLASFRPWALECLFGNGHWDFFTSSWCLLLAPFLAPLVIGLSSWLFLHCSSKDNTNNNHSNAWMWQYRTLYVWELLYVPVSSRVFALFHCISHDALSYDYLSSQPWISCSESRFMALRGFAIFVLIVFVLALPVVSVYGVAKDWVPFQFMKRSFHERTWWWQAVVWRMRALALVMFVQLLPYDSAFIPILVWVLLLASISLNLVFRPYRVQQDAWLMTALLAMSTIIYQTSIVSHNNGDNNTSSAGAAVFVQVCYALCLVLILLTAAWHHFFPKTSRPAVFDVDMTNQLLGVEEQSTSTEERSRVW